METAHSPIHRGSQLAFSILLFFIAIVGLVSPIRDYSFQVDNNQRDLCSKAVIVTSRLDRIGLYCWDSNTRGDLYCGPGTSTLASGFVWSGCGIYPVYI